MTNFLSYIALFGIPALLASLLPRFGMAGEFAGGTAFLSFFAVYAVLGLRAAAVEHQHQLDLDMAREEQRQYDRSAVERGNLLYPSLPPYLRY